MNSIFKANFKLGPWIDYMPTQLFVVDMEFKAQCKYRNLCLI